MSKQRKLKDFIKSQSDNIKAQQDTIKDYQKIIQMLNARLEKLQPKEPQYLYVFEHEENIRLSRTQLPAYKNEMLIGKIKLAKEE
jgi:hypothetical protein